MKRSKKYRESVKHFAQSSEYTAEAAVSLIKEHSFAKFDETMELAVRLNIKKSQIVRDTFIFPHSFGKESTVLVFAEGDKAEEAEKAGAAYVGGKDLIDRIKGGWVDFDVAVATPDMMKSVAALGQILGRRGLMPNPKARTVTNDITGVIQELKRGRVEFRSDKTGIVSLAVGKCSMEKDALVENILMICKEIMRHRPPETKGSFFKSATLSSTMGPGASLNVSTVG